MTKTATFTRAGLKRAIRAAEEAGLRVAGIRPDGTLLIQKPNEAPLVPDSALSHGQNRPDQDGLPAWKRLKV